MDVRDRGVLDAVRQRQRRARAAMGAVAVDRPTLFIQGTILVLAMVCVLLIADASHDVSEFAGGRGAARLGRGARGAAGRPGAHRDLPADPVRGRRHAAVPRLQRPADDVRGARGAVAAAVPAVRARAAPPPAVARGGDEVLPARRVLLGVLPVRHRDAVRVLRFCVARRDRVRGARANRQRHAAVRGHRADRGRAAVQGRRRAVPQLEAGRLPGRARPRSPR